MSDAFRLVRRSEKLDADAAKGRLKKRKVASYLTEHRKAARYYKLDAALETAVNTALAVGAPLLVTGEPGTGKTQLAWFLGEYFGIEVRPFYVKSSSTARDLKWEFDAVGYLQAAYAAREGGPKKERIDFLEKGPLWEAYDDPEPSVLLIDEIDKAPRDFPNDLLHELDQGWFHHPFKPDERVEPRAEGQPPIVVVTSNVERRLPAPFLRRCVFHHIELKEELVRHAVEARVEAKDFPRLKPEVVKVAVERFWDLQLPTLEKKPSTAELLVWLAVLNVRGTSVEELRRAPAQLPALESLIKDQADRKRLKGVS